MGMTTNAPAAHRTKRWQQALDRSRDWEEKSTIKARDLA